MKLWDFKDGSRNEILEWARHLSPRDRAALNQKLDLLERLDFTQAIGLKLLARPESKSQHILKLRVMCDTAMRPLLCRGPQFPLREYTLLKGASERDSRLHPPGVVETASRHRGLVENDETKRIGHERP